MATLTLEKLIHCDKEISISESYRKVKKKWDELISKFDWESDNSLKEMAKLVGTWQIAMEQLAGERWLGQEIMVIVGIGQFYIDGFGENIDKAKLVRDAFLVSNCSLEVKGIAEEMGQFYQIDEYYNDLHCNEEY